MAKSPSPEIAAVVESPSVSDVLTQKEWRLSASKVGGKPVIGEITATAAERAAVAAVLEALSIEALSASYKVKATGRNRFHLQGRVRASVTQACVVSNRPVEAAIDEGFDVDVWPADEIKAAGGHEETLDPFSADPPEALNGDLIDIASIAYQTLAVAIDPYPRHPDAAAVDSTEPLPDERPPSPFAALEALKRRS